MGLLGLYTTSRILNTTIGGVRNLSVVKCGSFVDLLFDECESVHSSTPEVEVS
jgi:hypothetical protein